MNVDEFIDIYDFNRPNLEICFKSDDCVLERKFLIPYDHHFYYLLNYLDTIDCKTIILENEYTDRDYLIDYANYYARCHGDYKRKCKRLHFFNIGFESDEEKKEIAKLLKGFNSKYSWDALDESYLGCIIAKPLPETIIGKTLLKPLENNDERKIKCAKEYKTHLSNHEFNFKSLAFQEQDTVCSACATSALWTAFHKTETLFPQTTSPPPYEITESATKFFSGSRPFPNGGLTVSQMCQAIIENELEPHVRGGGDSSLEELPILSLIYAYLRAEIPVILNAFVSSNNSSSNGYHSMTVTGYKINSNRIYTKEAMDNPCVLKGSRITSFYVHDDQLGPFAEIILTGPFKIGKWYQLKKEVIPVSFVNPLKGLPYNFWDLIVPSTIIIPLYQKIRIAFLNVYELVKKINRWLQAFSIIDSDKFEWDIFLIEGEKYKEKISNAPKYTSYRENIFTKPLPKYLWIINLNYNGNDLFEMTLDATDMERSFYFMDCFFFNNSFKNVINQLSTDQKIIDTYKSLLTHKFLDFLADAST